MRGTSVPPPPSETPPACHQTRVTHGASHRVGLGRCLCLPEAPVSHSVEWGNDMSDLFPRGGVRLKGDEKYCGYSVVHDKHEQAGVIPVAMSLASSKTSLILPGLTGFHHGSRDKKVHREEGLFRVHVQSQT